MAKKNPKILLLDIETSFKIAAVWNRFNQNISMDQLLQDTYVLCWCAAWLDGEDIYSDALHYHKKTYKKDPTNDREIIRSIWKLLDEADYVVAHNGANFDVPTLNARFIQHGLQPPSTYVVVDTLRIAKRGFRFTSNKLDDLAKALGLGAKIKTNFELWKSIIIDQDLEAFDRMVEYCQQDVRLLERVYLKIRPWDQSHPSTVVLGDLDSIRCNVCGSKEVVRNGSYSTNMQIYQKYKCTDCGHNMRSRKPDKKTKEQAANLLRSI